MSRMPRATGTTALSSGVVVTWASTSRAWGPTTISDPKSAVTLVSVTEPSAGSACFEHVEVVPLGAGRADRVEVVVGDAGERELAEHLAVGQQCVAERDAAQLWAASCTAGGRGTPAAPGPLISILVKPGRSSTRHAVAHGVALLGHRAAPGLRAEERVVVAGHLAGGIEPGGPFPAATGAEVGALGLQRLVQRRGVAGPAGGPFLVGEAHRVLVLVQLDRLVDGVLRGGVLLVTATVPCPHVERGRPVEDPLGGQLSGAAALGDAEAERVAVEEVAQPALGAEVRVAVGGVGDGAVHDAGDAGLAEHRHSLAGIEDLRLEALEVFAPQHVGELVGDAVEPHRGGLPLVRPEDVAVALLAQVVAGVGVAQQRQRGSRAPRARESRR